MNQELRRLANAAQQEDEAIQVFAAKSKP